MSIKNLSEVRRLPRLGKIKLGLPMEGRTYPKATDYFVCPDEVKEVYGDKPKELKILFPTEDPDQWAGQWLKCYSATRGLICKGDGETATALIDLKTGAIATRVSEQTELREMGCSPESCEYYQKKQCRRVMNLQFMLPDCKGLGVYQLDTTSFYSIVNINSGIDLMVRVCGRISMIPLNLTLVEQEVQPEGKKKKVHVLTLTAPYTLKEIQQYAQIPPARVLMPSPDAEPPEDLFPPEVLEEAEDFEKIFPIEPRPEAKAKPAKKAGRPKKAEKAGVAAPSLAELPPIQPTASIVTTAPPVLEPLPEAPTEAKPAPVAPTDKPKWTTLGFASEKEQGDMRLKLYDMLAKHIFANDLPPEQGPINSSRGWLREHGCEFPEDDRNPTRNVTKPQLEGLILEAQKLLDLTTL